MSHKPCLIPDWRRCYRLYSVQLSILIAILGFLQLTLLPMWQAQLSPTAYTLLNSVLACVLFVARLIKQQGPEPENNHE